MIATPTIFVSHSSKDRDLTNSLCQNLRSPEDEDQPAYQVFVDFTELVAGKPWPKQLHAHMAKCQAAVILLTKNAVSSPWVLKEATILAWRLSMDRDFHLFTVRFPDVTDKMLEKHKFSPLSLDFIQGVGSSQPDEIAQRIRDTLGHTKRKKTPFDRLVGRLSDLFGKVGDHTLEDVAETMRIDPPEWKPNKDLRAQFVEAIADQIICESLGGYDGVDHLIDELSLSTSAETLKQILWIVAPRWVDAEAAGKLVWLPASDPRRAAVINGAKVADFTASMYVRRAYPLSRRYQVIELPGGNAGNLVDHFTNEICNRIRKDEGIEDQNDAIIDNLKQRQPTLYVVLPPPRLPGKDMRVLLDRFPRLSFILWSGETLTYDEPLLNAEWLTPEIDLDTEVREYEGYREATGIINRMANT